MIYDIDALKAMIPLYLNDQLSAEEQHAFSQGLADYPELAAELAEYREIQDSYRDLEAETPFPNQDRLFSRIMEKIDREETADAHEKTAPRAVTPGWRERLRGFFYTTFVSPKVAWSVAAVQVVLLVALIGAMPERSAFQTLSTKGSESKGLHTLNVVFDEDAAEKEIRALLLKTGAVIVGGPSATGLYVLAVPQEQTPEEISAALSGSGIVTFVEPRY